VVPARQQRQIDMDDDMHNMQKRIEELEKQMSCMLIDKYVETLKTNGYVIIPNVLTSEEIDIAKNKFYNWQQTIPNHDKLHSTIDPHGIYKFHEAGQQEHAWYLRTRKSIIDIFKKIWDTEELTVSFDGSCYISKDCTKKDKCWTHTDQAANSVGVQCYQSYVSLTKNSERTTILYKKSHETHEEYFKSRNITGSKNWLLIDLEYLEEIKDTKNIIDVNPGDLVIWDSRTFHQNRYGEPNSEERIVQYLCYLPKSHIKNTKTQIEKRRKYFNERRTTSHWPFPIHVNGLQARTFGDISKIIDYSKLVKPDLEEYMDMINMLI
jgi:hypothetical protein